MAQGGCRALLMTMTGYSGSHCVQRNLPLPAGVWTETEQKRLLPHACQQGC